MTDNLDGPLILVVAGWVTYVIALSASRLLSRSGVLPDKPNHRSSHERDTSRAGGLAIFSGWFAGAVILAAFTGVQTMAYTVLSLAGLAILALGVGLADDKWRMSSYWKFAGQAATAALFAAIFYPLASAPFPIFGDVALGAFGPVLTVFWIVGFMNAFNFMDGANGIAAGSASVGMSAFAVIAAFMGAPFVAAAAILLAIACFGFLPANLKRGKIFMGDNGSQSISFLIAALAVIAASTPGARISALVMPVIFLPFIFDVTWTLVRRAVRRKNLLAAHREHNYQLMLRLGATHMRVAVIYMAMTAFCAAAAILMLALPPGAQWLAPAVLCAVFIYGALHIQKDAEESGLFDEDADDSDEALEPLEPVSQAAQ